MGGHNKRVLLAGDKGPGCVCLAKYLASHQYIVVTVTDGLQALRELHRQQFDAVVTDRHIQYFDGLDVLWQCHLVWPELPVILLSENLLESIRLPTAHGVYPCLPKPVDPEQLLHVLSETLSDKGVRGAIQADLISHMLEMERHEPVSAYSQGE